MPIWTEALPVRTIEGAPQFASSPPPAALTDFAALLKEAGCEAEVGSDAICQPESPLAALGCESIGLPPGIYPALAQDQEVVGTCYSVPPTDDQPRDAYLFRRGCAFRRNAAHILKVEDRYVLLTSADSLEALFAPIESPEEALGYAQLMTGLVARFAFESEPGLLYLQPQIEGTRVTVTDGAYRINLFHFVGCTCEPWVNSEVEVLVDRSGRVTWIGAVPVSMTTGFSCAD